jgi:hypothetical protein
MPIRSQANRNKRKRLQVTKAIKTNNFKRVKFHLVEKSRAETTS